MPKRSTWHHSVSICTLFHAPVRFGDGLSFSSFAVTVPDVPTLNGVPTLHVPVRNVEAAVDRWASGLPRQRSSRDVSMTVRVENQGPLAGSRAVMGFLTPPNAGEEGRSVVFEYLRSRSILHSSARACLRDLSSADLHLTRQPPPRARSLWTRPRASCWRKRRD